MKQFASSYSPHGGDERFEQWSLERLKKKMKMGCGGRLTRFGKAKAEQAESEIIGFTLCVPRCKTNSFHSAARRTAGRNLGRS